MRKKIEWEWELLDNYNEGRVQTLRAKVIGGWLVKSVTQDLKIKVLSESMVFIPDRDHEWMVIEPFDPSKTSEVKKTVNPNDFEAPKA